MTGTGKEIEIEQKWRCNMDKELPVSAWPEWKIIEKIGEGSFGKVYKAQRTERGKSFYSAIKIINIPGSQSELNSVRSETGDEQSTRQYFQNLVEECIQEISTMEYFRGNSYIVSVEDFKVMEYLDVIGWEISIRMEYLTSFMDYCAEKQLTEKEVIKLGMDLSKALEYCRKLKIIHRDIKTVDLDISKLSKGGFDHFMLKEIYDQPQCLKDCMSGRLFADKANPSNNHIVLSALTDYKDRLMSAKHIIIVACGTSWHAALIGKQLIEKMCRKRVEVEYASEFRYGEPVIESDDVVIAISQSGETADTLAAIQLAKQHGALIFGIVNGVGSSIARETDTGIYIHVGPEIGVASTKAFTGQVTVLTLFALALGHELGTLSEKDYVETIAELAEIPGKMEKVLEQTPSISRLAKVFTYAHNFLYLGRGFNYPVALEGALKLKEISYIHAEGYPAAEMKHGPIALVDTDMPIVFLATHHQLYEKIISNMQEVKSRNGRILAIVTEGDKLVKAIADSVIEVPQTLNALVPLLSVVPLQILAYYVAVDKGLNVDMPRNLAKSVTVE